MSAPPPPPQPYGSQPPAASGTAAIGYGWAMFVRHVGPLVLLALVVVGVMVSVNIIGRQIDTDVVRLMWGIIGAVIGYVVTIGIVRAALVVVDGGRPEVGLLFSVSAPVFLTYVVASILFGIMYAIGLTLLVLPGLIVLFLFQFYGFAVVDTPGIRPVAALGRSFDVVRRNIGPVLVFDLIAVLLLFLGALALVIGLLVAYPVVVLGEAFLWRRLTGGHVAPT